MRPPSRGTHAKHFKLINNSVFTASEFQTLSRTRHNGVLPLGNLIGRSPTCSHISSPTERTQDAETRNLPPTWTDTRCFPRYWLLCDLVLSTKPRTYKSSMTRLGTGREEFLLLGTHFCRIVECGEDACRLGILRHDMPCGWPSCGILSCTILGKVHCVGTSL